jgi:hypothetical protein
MERCLLRKKAGNLGREISDQTRKIVMRLGAGSIEGSHTTRDLRGRRPPTASDPSAIHPSPVVPGCHSLSVVGLEGRHTVTWKVL